MRIAVVASVVTPLREPHVGGAQAFLCDLARKLANRGHDLTVYCAAGSEVQELRLVTVPISRAVEAALIRPAGSPAPVVPEVREGFKRLFAAVRADHPDAVSQHAFDVEAIELAVGLPVLHTLHMPPIVPAVVAAAVRSPDRFLTVSEAMKRAWRAVGLGGVEVIPNGVPDFRVDPAPVEPWALVAGRVTPEKGTATAVRVAESAGLEPVLVGEIYDAEYHRREVHRSVRALPRPELWRLMSRCAVTLMPVEWEEPFGLVAAESQLAGCPVVAYRRGGLPEVIDPAVGGYLVEPGDVDGLVAATRLCLELDRVAARESARTRLLIGPVAKAYEQALARLAAGAA